MAQKNRKNQQGKAFLKNFTQDYINRMILADKEFINREAIIDNKTMRDKLKDITEEVNYIVQNLNLKVFRNIPYLSLCFTVELSEYVRLLLRDVPNPYDLRLQVDDAMNIFINISHLLDIYVVSGGQEMYVSDNENVDGKIVADYDYKEIAIMDIFLDIAMFNSYSFLKGMHMPLRKKFSKMKSKYYEVNELKSFFINEDDESLDYYSFAFACHTINEKEEIEFDIDKYIEIWNDFIKQNYPNENHKEFSIEDQIEMRVDNHIPNDYYTKFDTLAPGMYFIFRINRKDIPVKRKASVDNMFKKDNSKIGDLCIVTQDEAIRYFDTFNELFTDLYIAPFKIVKQ